MAASTETLLRQALELPANDRAALIDGLIVSLDKPDPAVDALWLEEAESRMAAYRSGELEAVGSHLRTGSAEMIFPPLSTSKMLIPSCKSETFRTLSARLSKSCAAARDKNLPFAARRAYHDVAPREVATLVE